MSNVQFLRNIKVRFFSVKSEIKLDNKINTLLDNKLLKHRNHPGITTCRLVKVPTWITNSVLTVLRDEKIPKSILHEGGQKLMRHLNFRNVINKPQVLEKQSKTLHSDDLNKDTDECNIEADPLSQLGEKQFSQNSSALRYNRRIGLFYAASRSLYDYSVLYNVLNQIKNNDTNYNPKTLFDFGSGIGTVMWAASQLWSHSLEEYFAVDPSSEMNDLSEELAKENTHPIRNIFYRQFFPASSATNYDIVVSSFSLSELPDLKARFDVIQKLWAKTKDYLVIIEEGTNSGYSIINEARNIVLYNTQLKGNTNYSHVLAPCPHDMECPRYQTDNTPCNFEIFFYTLPFCGPSHIKQILFSYVILKKGVRPDHDKQWPRIVRPTLRRSKHVVCRTCTAAGKLEEIIFTSSKHGKNTYRCARASRWGDLLPVEISEDK